MNNKNYKNHLFLYGLNFFDKNSNHKTLELHNSKFDIKKVFTEHIKFKLKNYNKSNSNNNLRYRPILFKKNNKGKKNLKLSFSKNSQTTIKKYKYFDFPNNSKQISKDLSNNSKQFKRKLKIWHSAKNINKKNKNLVVNPNNKKLLNRNSSLSKVIFKTKNLKINNDFFFNKKYNNIKNIKNIYKLNISNTFNKNQEFNLFERNVNLNKKSDTKYDKSEINIFSLYSKNSINKEKFIDLKKDISYMQYNDILLKNRTINSKQKEKKSDWKNKILESIITNITKINKKGSKINFYDDNYNHQNIKMFTILDLYKKTNKNF